MVILTENSAGQKGEAFLGSPPVDAPIMNSSRYLLPSVRLSLAFFAVVVAPAAMAQTVKKIEASDPTFEDLQSPSVGGNTGKKSWKPKDWLEVEVKVGNTFSCAIKKLLFSLTFATHIQIDVTSVKPPRPSVAEVEFISP